MIVNYRKEYESKQVGELIATCIGKPTPEKIEKVLNGYQKKGNDLYLYVHDEKAVGLMGLVPGRSGAMEILHIAVHEKQRKRGIGRILLEFAAEIHADKTLYAETDRDAVDFYRDCGYEIMSLGKKKDNIERFKCVLSRQKGYGNAAK
jgi:ribosomal protein S18 acetylase RimI-like enzyme